MIGKWVLKKTLCHTQEVQFRGKSLNVGRHLAPNTISLLNFKHDPAWVGSLKDRNSRNRTEQNRMPQ